MRPEQAHKTDDLLEVLKAYRLPTIIMSVGLIASIFIFYLSLRYDLDAASHEFNHKTEETVRATQKTIEQRQQLVTSLAVIFENIQNLEQHEFQDIANSFIDTTSFVDFRIFKYDLSDGLIKLGKDEIAAEGGSITARYTSSPDTEDKLEDIGSLPVIRETIETVHNTRQTTVSRAFTNNAGDSVLVVVAPVNKQNEPNLFLIGVLDLSAFFFDKFSAAEISDARVYDTHNGDEELIYEQIKEENREFLSLTVKKENDAMSFQRRIFFEDHFWNIVIFSPLGSSAKSIGLFPWVIFLMAIALTALISFIVFRITTETLKIRKIVDQQTLSLKNYARRLEISNRDLEDFAHVASHDLKEPLRGIYNYAEFLIEDYEGVLDENGKEKLHTLRKLARRMEGFIESLLRYSMLTHEDFTMKKANLNDVLRNVLNMQNIWLEEHNVEVVIEENLPTVRCDPIRVAEVYRNLITNGVKYNDSDKKVITIGCITDFDQWNDIPVLFVRDNGIGIDEKNKDLVFKMFKRLHQRDAYGGGTGAGLTLVWKIIKRHKGKIWLESKPGKGTTFFFTLKEKPNAGQ